MSNRFPSLNFTVITQRRLLVLSIIAVCVVIHTPPLNLPDYVVQAGESSLRQLLQRWNPDLSIINPLRAIVFFLSVGFLFYLISKPIKQFFTVNTSQFHYRTILINSLKIFLLVSLLVLPSTLGIMGVGYAQMSISPFSFLDSSNLLYQRLLMPALANLLQFKGAMLYHIFSVLITVGLIFLLQIFFLQKKITLTILEYVSIATSSFIITQFQSPGYTEPLAYLLILLLFILELDELPRVAIFALAIFAHEVSILLLLVISAVYFSKRELGWIVIIGLFYGFVWLLSFGFDVERLMRLRNMGGASTLQWLAEYPLRELLGIFFSFKILWFFIFFVVFKVKTERQNILLFLLPGLILTLLAVDTSRLMGFSFVALLTAIVYIKQHSLLRERQFNFLCGLNLCIPAVYVGLNSGVVYFNGVYQLLQFGVFIK